MTLDEAREEIPNIEIIKHRICDCCKSNDWYCPKECDVLKKAEKMGIERLQRLYAEYDGAEWEVARYIQRKVKYKG